MGPSSVYGKHKTASARKISNYSGQINLQFFNKPTFFRIPNIFRCTQIFVQTQTQKTANITLQMMKTVEYHICWV